MRRTVLETRRLRVTTWEPGDLDDLAALHADPEVMAHLGHGRPEPASVAAVRLDGYLTAQAARGWTKWRVEDTHGRMIGRAGFGPFGSGRELGYVLARGSWGRGMGTEVAQALVDWDRSHPLTPARPLLAFAVLDNAASRRVLDKVGFTLIGRHDRGGRLHAFYELRG